jgi:hypothetical protein
MNMKFIPFFENFKNMSKVWNFEKKEKKLENQKNYLILLGRCLGMQGVCDATPGADQIDI